MSLLQETSTSITQSKYKWHLCCITIVYFLFSMMPSYFLSISKDDNSAFVIYYAFSMILECIVGSIYRQFIETVTTDIIMKFVGNNYDKYEKLDYESKNKIMSDEFHRKTNEAAYNIAPMISWGSLTLIHLISSIFESFFIFYNNELYFEIVFVLATNTLAYLIIVKKMHDAFAKIRERTRNENDGHRNMIANLLPQFESGDKKSKILVDINNKIYSNHEEVNKKWNKNSATISLINAIISFICIVRSHDNIKLAMLVIFALAKFSSTLSGFMNFMNRYTMMSQQFIGFEKMWIGLMSKSETSNPSAKIPKVLHIDRINIVKDKYSLTGPRMQIKKGANILLRGPSGGGKTTFINALLGKIKGIQIRGYSATAFSGEVFEFYQHIKERIPTKTITIRQLFDDEPNNDLINHCLKIVKTDDWIHKLTLAKKHKSKERAFRLVTRFGRRNGHISDDKFEPTSLFIFKLWNKLFGIKSDVKTSEPNAKIHPFDININCRHSGGQKTRLCLAIVLYRLKVNNGSMLILDEPEQGTDPKMAYEVINNIMREFPSVTKIIISHLEMIETKYTWSNIYKIESGRISKI